MGGINCGASNRRVTKNDIYRLEYAAYTKNLFLCLEHFYRANALVEEFTILEKGNSEAALSAYKTTLGEFEASLEYLRQAYSSLSNCYNEIAPLFHYSRLKEGAIAEYRSFDALFAKSTFEQAGVVTSETRVWNEVVDILQSGGEVDYLKYQQAELNTLQNILEKLLEEYKSLEKSVSLGISHIAIRDIDVQVTPYTAMALTKLNDIISSLTYLCLVEFSAHTSISGKKLDVFDLIPNRNGVNGTVEKIG